MMHDDSPPMSADASHHKRRLNLPRFGFVVALVALGIVVFSPGFDIAYYADNFQHVFRDPADQIAYFWTHPRPSPQWFRPLETTTLLVIQALAGLETWPIHLTVLAVHLALVGAVLKTTLDLGYGRTAAAVAALFMLLAQTNAYPVGGNGTLAQVGGSCAGFLSLYLLYRGGIDPDSAGSRRVLLFLGSLTMFIVALLFKESSTAYLGLVAVVLGTIYLAGRGRRSIIRSALSFTPYVAIAIGYLLYRSSIGGLPAQIGSGTYDFNPGANVIANLAQLVFAALLPVSTVTAFVAAESRDLIALAGMVVLAGAIGIVLAYGLWQSEKRATIAVLALLGLLAFFPFAALNHVSELYVYNALPFISILAGIGTAALLKMVPRKPLPRLIAATILTIVLSVHVTSLAGKLSLMNANGERAQRIEAEIEPLLSRIPEGEPLVLKSGSSELPDYSVFLMHDFYVFRHGQMRFAQLAGRPNLPVRFLDDGDSLPSSGLMLSLEGGVVSVIGDGN